MRQGAGSVGGAAVRSTVGFVTRPSISGLRAAISAGETTAVDVVTEHLDRIDALDASLNAFSVVLRDQALAEAAQRDAVTASGPLHGVPFAIKEEIDVAGTVTTFGGLGNSRPATADAEVVRRLREAGAVIIGKTRMPEFGSFPYTESEAFGETRNPWSPAHSPGGSSGGSAVAVATGMAAAAMGGDGGGSIRIPAACVGLFGLKPQRGRVTTAPHPHLWWGLGTAGPLTRTVMDSAIIYDVISGTTAVDLWHAEPIGSLVDAAQRPPGRLRIGWSAKPVTPGIKPDPLNVAALEVAARHFAELGHDVRRFEPRYPDPTAAFVPQFFASIRTEAEQMQHPERLERRTRQTRAMGAWVTPKVRDWALRQGEAVSTKANRIFDDIDVLLTPVMANRPPQSGVIMGKGTLTSTLRSMPAITYMALWNVAGNPAASLPVGVGSDGLPLAVQIVGRSNDESTLISLAAQYESAHPFTSLPS